MRNRGKGSHQKWITTTSIWQKAYNLAPAGGGSNQNIDVFSFKPDNTGAQGPDVGLNVAAMIPVTDRYLVSGWLDVFIGPGPSNVPLGTGTAELGSVACGLYKTVWDDATSNWATQSSLLNADINRGNWLYLNAKGYFAGYTSSGGGPFIQESTPAPHFRINIPVTTIEQGDALFLHVSTWLSAVGTLTNMLAMILNGRLRIKAIS